MLSFADREKAITIAVSLLKQRKLQTVQTLKDLLTFIHNPDDINDVLTAAVLSLVQTCPKTALWLFRHPDVLAPEIQAKDIIAQALTRQAFAWGYTDEDFHFTADNALEVTEATRQALLFSQPHPDEQSAFDLIRVLLAIAMVAQESDTRRSMHDTFIQRELCNHEYCTLPKCDGHANTASDKQYEPGSASSRPGG